MITLELTFFDNLQTKILSSAFLVVKELGEAPDGKNCKFIFPNLQIQSNLSLSIFIRCK